MIVRDLQTLDYRSAWDEQEQTHSRVFAGGEEEILLVEHPPVITYGRRAAESASHVVATAEELKRRGVEIVESDRGGDVTFHGPGQLVAYPIVRLADRRLSVGGYVKALEHAVIDCLAVFGLAGRLEEKAIGVWIGGGSDERRATSGEASSLATYHPSVLSCDPTGKICALGVRIKRGVSFHGVALNVTTDLSYFDLIVPCGLTGRAVTTMENRLGFAPAMGDVKAALVESLLGRLSGVGRPVS